MEKNVTSDRIEPYIGISDEMAGNYFRIKNQNFMTQDAINPDTGIMTVYAINKPSNHFKIKVEKTQAIHSSYLF